MSIETLFLRDFRNRASTLNRRSFLQSTAALAVLGYSSSRVGAEEPQKDKGIFRAVELNHLALDVPVLERSEEFYRIVFGLTTVSHGRGGGEKFMHFQQGFMNMRTAGEAGMNHFCFSIQNFNGEAVYRRLDQEKTEPFRMGGRNLHCYDPDRLNVQVQEEKHGWGRINGSQLTEADKGLFKTVRLHHVSVNVTNLKASQEFYQRIFGLPLLSEKTTPQRVLLGVGPSAYLELHQSSKAGLNHFCFAVENLDSESVPAELKRWVTGEISRPEPGVIRFQDPQGIIVEVASLDYKMT